jgi:hypothetical protein
MIWPPSGHYCIATPGFKDGVKVGYRHTVHNTTDEAHDHVRSIYGAQDVYFGIFTHLQPKVFDPRFQKMRPSRKRENMDRVRCLFLDLDVGKPDKGAPKYASQSDALAALARFIFQTGLPEPYVVSSGNGLHVYWPLTDAMTVVDWKPLAVNLRLLMDAHRMLYDPSRTVDITSVLRVPATLNHKDPDDLKKVAILHEGEVTDTDNMVALLTLLAAGMQPIKVHAPIVTGHFAGGSLPPNLSPHGVGFAPTDADDVAAECEQIRMFRDTTGNISEPHWYAALGVVGFCTNGAQVAQVWSSGHPQYDPAEVASKLAQWQTNGSVASCAKLATDGMQGVCQRCPHFNGQFKNPIVITNKKPVSAATPAPAQALPTQLLPTQAPAIIAPSTGACPQPVCDPPYPYARIQSLGVTRIDSKGLSINVLDALDLYPISAVSGLVETGEAVNFGGSTWVARERDSKGQINHVVLDVPNQHLADSQKLSMTLMRHGVYANVSPEVPKFMSAYLKELKAQTGLMKQYAHLGWPDIKKYDKFILNKKVIDAQGQVAPCIMAPQTNIATSAFTRAGTLLDQVEALQFYSGKAYTPHQFFILCSLGTPLFIAAGHHGVVINASGESGASKSTALKAAAGIWADPVKYVVNGTARGMSPMARDQRAATLPNLPTMVDEITLMDPEDARNMVMGHTQGTGRITLTGERTVKESRVGGYMASLMLTTANISLHQLVNTNSAAGTANSARILEIIFDRAKLAHTKTQADAASHKLNENYGWLGEHFMQLAMPCIDWLMDSVRKMVVKLNSDLGASSMERFYVAAAASAFVAGAFAVYHGLLDWDMNALYAWFVKEQAPAMRDTLNGEAQRLSYPNVMRDFIGKYTLDTLNDDGSGNIPPANIHTEVVIHRRTDLKELWINRSILREFCDKRKVSIETMLEALRQAGVVKHKDTRKPLGGGTRYAGARPHVTVLHSDHPEIA